MDYSKKKVKLIEEIEALQEKIAQLEHAQAERKRAEEVLRRWYPLRPPGGGVVLAGDRSGARRETRTRRENDALAV
jgi:hypothetical protein